MPKNGQSVIKKKKRKRTRHPSKYFKGCVYFHDKVFKKIDEWQQKYIDNSIQHL